MVYSRSADYALRACVHLARVPEGTYVMARSIAERENIPAYFLAKILQDLARRGLLRSNKGPSGGFALKVPPAQIPLLDLIEALDGTAISEAAGRVPWTLDQWKSLHSRIMEVLAKSTVADVAKALDAAEKTRGKKRPVGRRP